MQQKSKAAVFVGQAFGTGIYRHLAFLGVELYKACPSDIEFYFASVEREANPGAWSIVRDILPERNILSEQSFDGLAARCVELARSYEKVLIHAGGGWGQTKCLVRARKRIGKELAKHITFMGTTHSYRNDSLLRIPMSLFQYALYRLYYRMIVFQCKDAADRFIGGNHLIQIGRGTIIPLGCEPFGVPGIEPPSSIGGNVRLLQMLRDESLFKFVYLAGFRPGKMHVWLVKALVPVLKRHPEARVLFCGKGAQEVIDATVAAIREEQLDEQILLPGQIAREEVPWLLTHCNCAVVPSRSETFGHSFLEPMFAGLPVLGTRVGIGRDIIKDGETGYVFDLKQPTSVQDVAEKVLTDRAAARAMGQHAKAFVETRFTHEAVAHQLVDLYAKLLT